jgi:hypothetical protein
LKKGKEIVFSALPLKPKKLNYGHAHFKRHQLAGGFSRRCWLLFSWSNLVFISVSKTMDKINKD